MNDYFEQLAPRLDDAGRPAEPFEEWWPRVRDHFGSVPEEAARYWLHEHWGQSPFRSLHSAEYRFKLVDWPSGKLDAIRSGWYNFEIGGNKCLNHGRHILENHENIISLPTPTYMLEHGQFPTPIIVLDNRDGHLQDNSDLRSEYRELPSGYVLIEGHRRHMIALALHDAGKLKPAVRVWLMEHVRHCKERRIEFA